MWCSRTRAEQFATHCLPGFFRGVGLDVGLFGDVEDGLLDILSEAVHLRGNPETQVAPKPTDDGPRDMAPRLVPEVHEVRLEPLLDKQDALLASLCQSFDQLFANSLLFLGKVVEPLNPRLELGVHCLDCRHEVVGRQAVPVPAGIGLVLDVGRNQLLDKDRLETGRDGDWVTRHHRPNLVKRVDRDIPNRLAERHPYDCLTNSLCNRWRHPLADHGICSSCRGGVTPCVYLYETLLFNKSQIGSFGLFILYIFSRLFLISLHKLSELSVFLSLVKFSHFIILYLLFQIYIVSIFFWI